jgi:hypothetical protein
VSAAPIPADFVPTTKAELARCMADPLWRICSGQLYKIMVKSANEQGETAVPFKPNRAQRRFIAKLHTRNIILKARQLGFTTLVAILWLDHALFNENQRCVIVAQDRDKAEEIFRDKVKFAYERLPKAVLASRPTVTENKSELLFSNNSSIKVSTSARGGTPHRLHISEYGKICAKFPDKAQEIMTGSFPAVPLDGITIVESTAEGQEGDFYEMTDQAMAIADSGRVLTQRDYRFHFYPWWHEPGYRLSAEQAAGVVITAKEHEYFDEVQAVMGCTLDLGQRAWYIATREADFKGDPQLMWQEYPSTPREAFQQSTEGFYYAVQLAQARQAKRITSVPYMAGYPVNSFWDIGNSDGTAVWLHQHVGMTDRFIGFIEGWEKPYDHFTAEMQRWAARRGDVMWGIHHLPHDAEHKRQLGRTITSPLDELKSLKLGGKWHVVDRVDDLQHGIQLTRAAFSHSWFDETECKDGLIHLAGYKKKWNRSAGAWSNEPVKNPHTEAADGYRQFAQGFHAPMHKDREESRKRNRNWRTA